jgi:hypothetical protein
MYSAVLSLLPIDALDNLLSSQSLRIESPDTLLTQLVELGYADPQLIRHVPFELLSLDGVSAFADRFASFDFTESIWDGITAVLRPLLLLRCRIPCPSLLFP